MVYFYPEGHGAHAESGHPERPERVEMLRRAIQAAGWWEPYPQLAPILPGTELLERVHSRAYLEYLKRSCQQASRLDADTYTVPATWELALQAVGGALAVAMAVWGGEAQHGFALTRPPGHHATITRGMGFCLLNNVALAAEHLLGAGGATRLAIIDLDLHHGNGTQDIFWRRGEVFFISIHQSPLYPMTGSLEERGEGPGFACNANIPLPPGSGDSAYRAIFEEVLIPLLDRFEPEMLLVSFGFDPHWRDPLGHLQLSAGTYGELIRILARWADEHCRGRLALFLEGGYDLEAGAACAQTVTAALLDQFWPDPLGPSPRPEGKSWQNVTRRAKELWGLEK
jgi:acetoin utilization deacetylase AcuC-like enzyme